MKKQPIRIKAFTSNDNQLKKAGKERAIEHSSWDNTMIWSHLQLLSIKKHESWIEMSDGIQIDSDIQLGSCIAQEEAPDGINETYNFNRKTYHYDMKYTKITIMLWWLISHP